MKINKSIFRYVEHELYSYEQTKKELELYKESLIESTPKSEVPVMSALSDTTAVKAINLAESTFILKLERVINAIKKCLGMLGDNHRELFRLKYIKGLTMKEIYIEMNLSKASYYRIRREIVIAVAQQLGLLRMEG